MASYQNNVMDEWLERLCWSSVDIIITFLPEKIFKDRYFV